MTRENFLDYAIFKTACHHNQKHRAILIWKMIFLYLKSASGFLDLMLERFEACHIYPSRYVFDSVAKLSRYLIEHLYLMMCMNWFFIYEQLNCQNVSYSLIHFKFPKVGVGSRTEQHDCIAHPPASELKSYGRINYLAYHMNDLASCHHRTAITVWAAAFAVPEMLWVREEVAWICHPVT